MDEDISRTLKFGFGVYGFVLNGMIYRKMDGSGFWIWVVLLLVCMYGGFLNKVVNLQL
jgi:hypothetical protein